MTTTALGSLGKAGRQILRTFLIRFRPESRITKCIEVGFMEISTWLIWSCPSPCFARGDRRLAHCVTALERLNLLDTRVALCPTPPLEKRRGLRHVRVP